MRLMLVPEIVQALADAEAAVDACQLTARRRSGQFRSDAWAASAAASAGLDGSDPRLAAAVLLEVQELANIRSSLLHSLARLHAAAAVDLPLAERGRPRSDFTHSARLTGLADLVATSTAPALLLAHIAHADLLSLAPFGSENGLIARAIWRGVIVESGLDPTGMVMVEVGLRDLGSAAYAAALSSYESGTPAGVAAWIIHCSRAVELGVDALAQLIG